MLGQDDKPTLLVFRVDTVRDWPREGAVPVPEGCSALAVSGGMERFRERWNAWRCRSEILPPTPFLHDAPPWLVSRLVWSLLGVDGRLYPVLTAGSRSSVELGLPPYALPDTQSARYTLKLDSCESASSVPWVVSLLNCCSDGIALGFAGKRSAIERQLRSKPGVVPLRLNRNANGVITNYDAATRDEHLWIYEAAERGGVGELLSRVPLLLLPWGWERSDGLFISSCLSQDEMVGRFANSLSEDVEIVTYAGSDTYADWVGHEILTGLA